MKHSTVGLSIINIHLLANLLLLSGGAWKKDQEHSWKSVNIDAKCNVTGARMENSKESLVSEEINYTSHLTFHPHDYFLSPSGQI